MILHIPHSQTTLPVSYPLLPIKHLNDHTDWFTDELFDHPSAQRLVFPYSRFYADMERLRDDPMEVMGMGILYTQTPWGVIYRQTDCPERADVYQLYEAWHSQLSDIAAHQIDDHGYCVLVDCHSFGSHQVSIEESQLPDFNIGTNEHTTSTALLSVVKQALEAGGYSVGVNYPYSYSIEPSQDHRFETIMIEVNKHRYLTADYQKSAEFNAIQAILSETLKAIAHYEQEKRSQN